MQITPSEIEFNPQENTTDQQVPEIPRNQSFRMDNRSPPADKIGKSQQQKIYNKEPHHEISKVQQATSTTTMAKPGLARDTQDRQQPIIGGRQSTSPPAAGSHRVIVAPRRKWNQNQTHVIQRIQHQKIAKVKPSPWIEWIPP